MRKINVGSKGQRAAESADTFGALYLECLSSCQRSISVEGDPGDRGGREARGRDVNRGKKNWSTETDGEGYLHACWKLRCFTCFFILYFFYREIEADDAAGICEPINGLCWSNLSLYLTTDCYTLTTHTHTHHKGLPSIDLAMWVSSMCLLSITHHWLFSEGPRSL